jgi:hypothetical protein
MAGTAVSSASLNEVINTVQRLMNPDNVAEGISLPPPMLAGTRIDPPTDFQIALQQEQEGGTRFILRWTTPADMLRFRPRFRVYAYYGQGNVVWTGNQTVNTPTQYAPAVIVANTDTSPADFFIRNSQPQPIKFALEMRLGSGLVMLPEQRPSATAIMRPIEYYLRSVSADYAFTAYDRILRVDATAAVRAATLPNPTSKASGWWGKVRKTDGGANNVTVLPYGSETIDGGASATLTLASPEIILYTDGTNWFR